MNYKSNFRNTPFLRLAGLAYITLSFFAASLPAVAQEIPAASAECRGCALDEGGYFEELPVVLSVSRLRQPLLDVPIAVTVIDRPMIVASGARQIADLLRLVPGFYTGALNGNSVVVAYHGLSDLYARRMQVLIDGVSIYSPALGGVDWADLPVALQDIERIEVVRGSNAVSYGANAFLGVINIITRDPAGSDTLELAMNAGGNGVRDYLVRMARQADGLRYSLSSGRRADDGYYHLSDSTRTEWANLRAHWQLDGRDELAVQLRASRGDQLQGKSTTDSFYKIDIGSSAQHDPERMRKVGNNTLQLRWTRSFDVDEEFWLQLHHHQRYRRESSTTLLPLPFGGTLPYTYGADIDQRRNDIEFEKTGRHGEALRYAWGGQWRRDSAKSFPYLDKHDWQATHLTRVFGNLEYRPHEDWLLQGGLTLERHALTGNSLSPRVAANWRLAPGHSLRSSLSRANRLPTLIEEQGSLIFQSPRELLWLTNGLPLAILSLSSGNLREESIRARDIGYVFELPQHQLSGDIRLFRDRVERLVVMTASRPVITMTNQITWDSVNATPAAYLSGIEAGFKLKPYSGAMIHGALSHARIRSDISNGADSVPSTTASLLVSQQLPDDWQLSAAYYRVAAFKWQSSPRIVPAYDTLDLRLAKSFQWRDHRLEVAIVTRDALGPYADYKVNHLHRRLSYLQIAYTY
jgi:iron complex outermembrane receptor protein